MDKTLNQTAKQKRPSRRKNFLLQSVALIAMAGTPAFATTVFTDGSGTPTATLTAGCGTGTISGNYVIAIGCLASATGNAAIAIGQNATASGNGSITIGLSAGGTGTSNIVLGTSAAQASSGEYNVILGTSAGQNMTGDRNFIAGGAGGANGVAASATNVDDSIVIGTRALRSVSDVTRAVVLGTDANVTSGSTDVVAIGTAATGRTGSVVLGNESASTEQGVAIGNRASVTGSRSVAIGANSTDGGLANVVSVGSATQQRRIVNLAAGTADTDGVNVSQLRGVTDALGGGAGIGPNGSIIAPTYNVGGGTYNNVGDALTNIDGRTTTNTTNITNLDNRVTTVEGDLTTVTGDVTNILNGTAGIVRQVGGAPGSGTITVGAETGGTLIDMAGTDGKRKVTGVAEGDVTATSLDAINGSQLHGVSQSIATHLGGGATVGAGGIVIGPSYSIQGGNYTTVYDAFASVDGNITTIKTDITNLGTQIGGISQDALLWNAGKGAFSASHGGTVPNRITDVAPAELSATSTDAVNGSQLHATNQQVEQNTTDIANLDNRVTNVEGDITSIKGDITNIDNRVTNVENQVGNISNTVTNQGTQIAALEKGTVKYTLDANGNPTNQVNLTGNGSGGPVSVKNVATGIDDLDAVNVGQLKAAVEQVSGGSSLAVKYVGDSNGKPTNTVALTGDSTGSPVTIENVAAGKADTDAANYGQVKNQVGYDTDASGTRTNTVTLSGNNGASVTISNLANGVKDGDAVNVAQLNGVRADAHAYTDTKVGELRNYTDARLDSLSGNIREVQKEARGGIASVMAASQLRYADRPGVVSVAGGFGGFKGQTSFAAGLGWTSQDLKWKVNGSVGVSLNSGDVTWGVGASYAFD